MDPSFPTRPLSLEVLFIQRFWWKWNGRSYPTTNTIKGALYCQWYLESWCPRWGRLEWYRQWLQRQMLLRSWEAPWGQAWTSTRWESSTLILTAIPSPGSFYTFRIWRFDGNSVGLFLQIPYQTEWSKNLSDARTKCFVNSDLDRINMSVKSEYKP